MLSFVTRRLPVRLALLALLSITVIATACQDETQTQEPRDGASDVTTPTTVATAPQLDEPRPDAPMYAARGSFSVGYQALESGASDDTMAIHAWYPARPGVGASQQIAYDVVFKDTTWQPTTNPVVYGTATESADPDGAEGPYPLIVLSHSFTGSTAGYSSLAEHYASHGFIVLAPEHDEQFDETLSGLWTALIDRPADITRTLDYAEELTETQEDLGGLIDMDRVAVVGHSYGGYTALAMAGARIDMAAFNERCATIPDDHPSAFICGALMPNAAAMAERAGLDPDSVELWPSFGDPRVKAIIPMAGDAYLFDAAGLAHVTVPMMAMGGTADFGTPYDWGAQLAFDEAASDRKSLVGLTGAEHMIFATPCNHQPWMNEHPAYGYFCFDPVWDVERAQDLIHHLSTAFLLDVLANDPDAHAALSPEAVAYPGIEYRTIAE